MLSVSLCFAFGGLIPLCRPARLWNSVQRKHVVLATPSSDPFVKHVFQTVWCCLFSDFYIVRPFHYWNKNIFLKLLTRLFVSCFRYKIQCFTEVLAECLICDLYPAVYTDANLTIIWICDQNNKFRHVFVFFMAPGRKKSPLDPSCCPVCGITLRSSDLEAHFVQEIERLERVSRASRSTSNAIHNTNNSPSPSGSSVTNSATTQIHKREQDTRWEVML